MHQREIDNSVGNVIGGAMLGLVFVVVMMARYPLRTLASVFAGFVFYGIAIVAGAGIDKYEGYVAGVVLEEKRKRDIVLARESALKDAAFAIQQEAWRPIWKRIGDLTELERLEYQGNSRAKAFRAQYKISIANHPEPSWVNFDSFVDADMAAEDENFPRTRKQIASVLAKLAVADRYLKVVDENKSYFNGGRSQLILSEAFVKEFSQPSAATRKVTPPSAPAAPTPTPPALEQKAADGRIQVMYW